MRLPKAFHLKRGMLVNGPTPVKVKYTTDGPVGIIITFDLPGSPTLEYAKDEEVAFPVRNKEREKKNWIGQIPTMDQIFVGDRLSPHEPDDMYPMTNHGDQWKFLSEEDKEDEYESYARECWEDRTFQEVRLITDEWLYTYEWLGTDRPVERKYSIKALRPNHPVDIPSMMDYGTHRKESEASERKVEFFGPYHRILAKDEDGEPIVDTEKACYFAKVKGPGRIPASIPDYDRFGEGKMRQPTALARRSQENKQPNRSEWLGFWFNSSAPNAKRHPNDPRRGMSSKVGINWHPYGNPKAPNKRLTLDDQ